MIPAIASGGVHPTERPSTAVIVPRSEAGAPLPVPAEVFEHSSGPGPAPATADTPRNAPAVPPQAPAARQRETASAAPPAVPPQAPAARQRETASVAPPPVRLQGTDDVLTAAQPREHTTTLSTAALTALAQGTHLRSAALARLKPLDLSESVVETQITGAPIAAATLDRLASRYGSMNRYGGEQESGHVVDTAGPERDMSRMGLVTVYLQGTVDGHRQDLAYASMYPASVDDAVARRVGPYENGSVAEGTSAYYADALTRVDWKDMAALLGQKVPHGKVDVRDVMHLTDYAVGPHAEALEGNGLARMALKTMLGRLHDHQFICGFIDSSKPETADDLDHRTSTLASMSAGCFLAGSVATSHDGDHPSLIVSYSPSVEPDFSPKDLVIAHRRGPRQLDLNRFVDDCERLLAANPNKVVAFDPSAQAYVLTTLKSKAPAGFDTGYIAGAPR